MGKNTSIILGDHFDDFIKNEISTGRYTSVSEVIRTGLRLLESESKKIKLINEALVTGEESGTPKEFDNEAFKERMKKKLKKDASASS